MIKNAKFYQFTQTEWEEFQRQLRYNGRKIGDTTLSDFHKKLYNDISTTKWTGLTTNQVTHLKVAADALGFDLKETINSILG